MASQGAVRRAPRRGPTRRAATTPRQHHLDDVPEPTLVLAGEAARREKVAASLASLRLRIEPADTLDAALAAVVPGVAALVLIPPLPAPEPLTRVVRTAREDPRSRPLPLFVVVPDDVGPLSVRRLYAEGATAVIEWPREALLLPRIVIELLAVAPRPRSLRPMDRALARAASARLRLIDGVGEELQVGASRDGVLELSGTLPSLSVRQSVLAFASRIPGVRAIVDGRLTVRPSGSSDRTVAGRVRAILGDIVEGDTLSVSVDDGHVVLMGTVESRAAFEQVVGLLASVRGVRDITNLTGESGVRRRRDHRVAASLQREIERSHPQARVRVAVVAGVAVLTGRVDLVATRSEIRRLVERVGEVERVVDKIEVGYSEPAEHRAGPA